MNARIVPLAAITLLVSGCDTADRLRALGNESEVFDPATVQQIPGADPARGRALLGQQGCTTCHRVPGERAPVAHVGPPLTQFARRTNIGGSLPNRPDVLVRFLMNAPRELPGTGMPDLDLSEAQARDVAALLYTFR